MKKVIGYKTFEAFQMNCHSENNETRICEFQITGEGDEGEMNRLKNVLLENGFHIVRSSSTKRQIPIVE
jgi:hypothetical protein